MFVLIRYISFFWVVDGIKLTEITYNCTCLHLLISTGWSRVVRFLANVGFFEALHPRHAIYIT